jgi:hypothetical protein
MDIEITPTPICVIALRPACIFDITFSMDYIYNSLKGTLLLILTGVRESILEVSLV